MTSDIYLNIGSNCGAREVLIGRAVAALTDRLAPSPGEVKVSEPLFSRAQGFESAHIFLNVGVTVRVYRTDTWSPSDLENLLATIRMVERSISTMPHRNADGTYRDRELDIDLIAVDDIVYKSTDLELPHPRMSQRQFVLEPMSQLLPNWHHPISGLTASEMLSLL